MKPSFEDFKNACPEVNEDLLKEHLERLNDRYFRSFSAQDLYRHLRALSDLTPERPVQVLSDMRKDGSIDCTVLAFDYPMEFSIISGILAGSGYSISSGDVFTYSRIDEKPNARLKNNRARHRPLPRPPLKRRRIIDYFSGVLETSLSYADWLAVFKNKMIEAIRLLEVGDDKSLEEAGNMVNKIVVNRLSHIHRDSPPVLLPSRIEVDNKKGPFTRLKVISEDTPAFLYALTNALCLHNLSIEHVRIRTIRGRIEDQIDLVDAQGRMIEDSDLLNRIKLSALITKQFTYFLEDAPDPYAALSRFGYLVKDIVRQPAQIKWFDLLKNPNMLQDLAQILGASDVLWEDFIRTHYETLLPMLEPQMEKRRFSEPVEALPGRLEDALKDVTSFEEQRTRVNKFKDREIFMIDLDHILNPGSDFRVLSKRLTALAEIIVSTASNLVYEHLVRRFGTPRSIAGLQTRFTVLGLGKLGGAALGYASDIEMLFVYSDNGETDGKKPIGNAEFFDRLVKGVLQFIQAKREGIFHIDLRLRPYGNAGPLACSLENFCRYYGTDGAAHSYERLALIRMRAIGGKKELGSRLERIRDEMIYSSESIDFRELRDLRKKQILEKVERNRLNAKYNPGGLVDLEYGVQILQVTYGNEVRRLRTPRLHEALNALSDAGILSPDEAIRLIAAYDFLRRLINGMRMLRGSAKDLFLPPSDSAEFEHLARRIGYDKDGGLEAAQQLRLDFEAHTAVVRMFAEKNFGRDSMPGHPIGTIADLVLSDNVQTDLRRRVLSGLGFKDPDRAYVNLTSLAGTSSRRITFAKLAVLAGDILMLKPDPDMALNNWERFIRSLSSPEFHYSLLLSQPMRLEVLLSIFSGSQFLADTLVRNPGFLDWVIIPKILHKGRHKKDIEKELREAANGCRSHKDWLNKLRRLRRREILRIGTRDICMGISTDRIMMELSSLAEAFAQVVLERVWQRVADTAGDHHKVEGAKKGLCIMAFGKLGGNELNYSSDIDLMGICSDQETPGTEGHFNRVMENVRADLSSHTEEGYAYRVDLRLRPFGSSGELVPTISGLLDYYKNTASIWEIQAALKMRPVAGDLQLGYAFIEHLRPIILHRRKRDTIVESIERMRNLAVKTSSSVLLPTMDLKNGVGGLRDVEFLAQGLQLIHAPENPTLLEGNTLRALGELGDIGILSESVTASLKEGYIFLRRTEHYLQLLEDRQVHALPKDPAEVNALAKRLFGSEGTGDRLMARLIECTGRIREAFESLLLT